MSDSKSQESFDAETQPTMSSTTKPGSGFQMNDGDWICSDVECGNINFARRTSCNLCGREKPGISNADDPSGSKKKQLGHEIGKAAAEKSRGLFSADDWQCFRCGNVNWARRQTCNMCMAPKFGENEERTGLGGGYNDREQVEYVERGPDSDNEYDDFGRKKKKFRRCRKEDEEGNDSNSGNDAVKSRVNHSKAVSPPKHDDDEDDSDDDQDLSKYKLDDDDDDDDDDGDLSKYDLSDLSKSDKEERVTSTKVEKSSSDSPLRSRRISSSNKR